MLEYSHVFFTSEQYFIKNLSLSYVILRSTCDFFETLQKAQKATAKRFEFSFDVSLDKNSSGKRVVWTPCRVSRVESKNIE